jgi:hypothetical protein
MASSHKQGMATLICREARNDLHILMLLDLLILWFWSRFQAKCTAAFSPAWAKLASSCQQTLSIGVAHPHAVDCATGGRSWSVV